MQDATEAQRRMWSIGDYPTIAEHLLPISVETLVAAGVRAGVSLLDVGVGDGNAAIAAHHLGAEVTGVDLTPAQIDRARARCEAEGADVTLLVGDVERLDLPDASFDVVISVMGAILAPDHARAMAEMARVCAAGGTVAVTAWATGGWSTDWRSAVAGFVDPPAPGAPAPDEWGDPNEMRRRFAGAGLDATVEERPFEFRFPSEAVALDTFTTKAGPFMVFMEAVAAKGRADEAIELLRSVLAASNTGSDGTCVLRAPYLLGIAQR